MGVSKKYKKLLLRKFYIIVKNILLSPTFTAYTKKNERMNSQKQREEKEIPSFLK